MKKLRFNPFKQVHQGLRALLYDTALRLQHTEFCDAAEAEGTLRQVNIVLQLFHHHADIEDSHVLPLIQAHAPELVAAFEAEHTKDELLATRLDTLITAYNSCDNEEDQKATGIQLQAEFTEFMAFNLQHMNREETLINEVLWKNYSDEALLAVIQEIGASIPPEENQLFALWMLKGNNNADIANWLSMVKVSAPPFVYDNLYSLAAANLGKARLHSILNRINTPSLQA